VNAQKLVKMANEIASFFEGEADRNAVLEGVAGHLKRFWDPRMRREIVRWVDENGGEGLKESALLAIRTHRDRLVPEKKPNS
jgi:formate dehydrogenase subunit delta